MVALQHVGIVFANCKLPRPSFERCRPIWRDVSAEGPGTVMVLTVDVVGDGSADGDEARAGRDRKKPSFREKYVDDVGEADAAFAAQHASRFVESEDAVKAAAIDQFAAGVETRVAIAAAQTIGEQGAGRGSSENFRHLVVPRRLVDVTGAQSSGNGPTREFARWATALRIACARLRLIDQSY